MAEIKTATALKQEDLPVVERNTPRKSPPPMVDLLKVLLKIKCTQVGIASRLVASAAEVESLASDPTSDIRAVHGWRYDIFGRDALAMIDGKRALTSKNGQIAVVEVLESEDETGSE